MTSIAEAFDTVPARVYTDHEQRGRTPHRSLPAAIRRELIALDVRDGDTVLEIGTGSGYSGALLAAVAGPRGRVTSVDVDPDLTNWAQRIHHERGVDTITCHVADGLADYAAAAPYDRIVAWCTPPRLPQALVDQLADGGRIVAYLPMVPLPFITVVATITVDPGQPQVQAITSGGYVQSTAAPSDEVNLPGRWADWTIYGPRPSWISIGWRAADDRRHTGARATLDRLLTPGHTETYARAPMDWNSWNAYSATLHDSHLSAADLRQTRAIGHSTPRSRPRSWCRRRSSWRSGSILCGDRRRVGVGGVG